MFFVPNVGSCESRFGHTSLRFSSLWSSLLPFIWSSLKDNGIPFHMYLVAGGGVAPPGRGL